MMNDLTGVEGRKLRMPSVSPLRVMGRVTGRQRGWALGINTIPFHFPANAFPVEMATPWPANLSSSVWLSEATTICNSLVKVVHIGRDNRVLRQQGGFVVWRTLSVTPEANIYTWHYHLNADAEAGGSMLSCLYNKSVSVTKGTIRLK